MSSVIVPAIDNAFQRDVAATGKVEPAFRALMRALGLIRRVMEPYYVQHGVSASQWSVLRALNRAEEEGTMDGVRLTDLSDSLLVSPPSVTGAIDRLQRMGLVARKPSLTDQRAKLVSLTDEGRKLVDRVRQGHAQHVQRVLAALNLAEQEQLERLLNQLGDHLEVMTHLPLQGSAKPETGEQRA